jgi:hypothetical protein
MVVAYEREVGLSYTHICSARPDLRILSPLLWSPLPEGIRVPNFHHWNGLNDRFAYGIRSSMLEYMRMPHEFLLVAGFRLVRKGQQKRIVSSVEDAWWGTEVNSEKLLCVTMARIPVGLTPLLLQRVLNSGEPHPRDRYLPSAPPLSCVRHTGLKLVWDFETSVWADNVLCDNDDASLSVSRAVLRGSL